MKESRKSRKRHDQEVAQLEQSLQETRVLLAQAYAGFNAVVDSELVESYIYEIQALQARYSYLLRQRKALEPQSVTHPLEAGLGEPSALPVA